jgi:hypothetical protein
MNELNLNKKEKIKDMIINTFDKTPFTEEDTDTIADVVSQSAQFLRENDLMTYNGPIIMLFVNDVEPLDFDVYSDSVDDFKIDESIMEEIKYLLTNNATKLYYDYDNPRIAFQSDKYIVIYTRRIICEAKKYYEIYERGLLSIAIHEILHMDRYFKLLGTPEFEEVCGVTANGGINHDEEDYINSIVDSVLISIV